MGKDQFPFILRNLLPESSWPWVTAALRQNALLWDGLQDPALSEQAIRICGASPNAWTPAAISLAAYHTINPAELRLDPSELCSRPLAPLKNGLRQQVLRMYKSASSAERLRFNRSGENDLALENPVNKLAEAGMLALALRERLRKVGSWIDLPVELKGIENISLLEWETPLACLYGMIPDPHELLYALVEPQDFQTGIRLVVRILLNQPMPKMTQLEELKRLLDRLSSGQSPIPLADLILLRELSTQRSDLATALVDSYNDINESTNEVSPFQKDWSRELQDLIRQATYLHYSNQPTPALIRLERAKEKIQAIEVDLTYYENFLKSPITSTKEPVEFPDLWLPSGLANLGFIRRQQYRKELVNSLYEMGLWAECVEATKGALEDTPNDPELLLKFGKALLKQGKLNEASAVLQSAVLLSPDRLELRRQFAETLEAQQAWSEALEERENVVEKGEAENPNQKLENYHALAHCALQDGQIERAKEVSQLALSVHPEDGLAFSYLGEALFRTGKVEDGLSHLSQAVLLAPHLEHPWLVQARILAEIGQPQQSLETLKAASQALPESCEILLALGERLLDHQAPTQALEALRKGYDLSKDGAPSSVKTRAGLRLGHTLRQLGHLEEAQEVLAQTFQTNPVIGPGISTELAYLYAQTLMDHQDVCKALPILAEVIKTNPTNPSPYLDYGRALLTAGVNPAEASQVLERALEKDPCQYEARALLAEALSAAGDHPLAMQTFRACLETPLVKDKSWLARLSAGLGRSALALGQVETAIAALEEAILAEPDHPVYIRSLSDAYWEAGLYSRAIQSAMTVRLIDANNLDVLTWFGEMALKMIQQGPDNSQSEPDAPIPNHKATSNVYGPKDGWILAEAIDAARKAIQLAPAGANHLIRLGRLQILSGDAKEADHTLRRIIDLEQACCEDLQQVGKLFGEIGDYAHAITCLERAAEAQSDCPTNVSLLLDLADAYWKTGNPERALAVLKDTLQTAPNDARLYHRQADVLLDLDQLEPALAVLKEAMKILADPEEKIDVILRIARLNRQAGRFPEALTQVEAALDSCQSLPETTPRIRRLSLLVAASLLAADLQRAVLQPEKGYQELQSLLMMPLLKYYRDPKSASVNPDDSQAEIHNVELPHSTQVNILEAHCLAAELALEAGEEIEAAKALNQMIEHATATVFPAQLQQSPRLMALQSRLLLRQNDVSLARQFFEEALNTLENSASKLQTFSLPACRLGLAEAALELREWETALKLTQEAIQEAPDEPFVLLNLARMVVEKAEIHQLHQALGIITHTPDPQTLNEKNAGLFSQTIEAVARKISSAENTTIPGPLTRWIKRGKAVFEADSQGVDSLPASLTVEEWLGGACAPLAGDYAAFLAYLEHLASIEAEVDPGSLDNLRQQIATQVTSIVSQLPQNTLILMQAARAIYYHNPQDAICTAQAAIHSITDSTSPSGKYLSAIAHSLLACLAHQAGEQEIALEAIRAAIETWGDEPRWRTLAADCLESLPEITGEQLSEALVHRQEAVRLEPNHLEAYLSLGRSCLIASQLDKRWLAQAINTLEQACHQALENPLPWLWLAEAHLSDLGGNEKQRRSSLKEAAACAERAIGLADREANPCGVRARIVRAETALQLGEAETAYEYAQEAVQLMPGEASAVLAMTNALEAMHQPAEALAALEKALPWMTKQADQKQALALNVKYAELVRQSQGADAALRIVNGMMETFPGEPEVLALLARNLNENDHTEAAIQAAQMALQASAVYENREPGNSLSSSERAKLHSLAGTLLGQNGQLDNAIHHLNEAIHLDPQAVDSYLELGAVYQKQRQYLKAQKIYEQATEAAPHDPRPFVQAGLAFKEGKDYQRAESMLRRAAELSPDDVDVKKMLAGVAAHNILHGGSNQAHRSHILAGR